MGIERAEYEPMKLSELQKMFDEGWEIYDTQTTCDPDIKILTLVRVQAR